MPGGERDDGEASKRDRAGRASPPKPMRRRGADCLVVVRHRLCRPTANETAKGAKVVARGAKSNSFWACRRLPILTAFRMPT